MDVKTYYQRIRAMEATIPTPFTVVVSMATDDGGKKGVLVEVPVMLSVCHFCNHTRAWFPPDNP